MVAAAARERDSAAEQRSADHRGGPAARRFPDVLLSVCAGVTTSDRDTANIIAGQRYD